MNCDNALRTVLLLGLLLGCSSPHSTSNPESQTRETGRSRPPLWRPYITITPEQIAAARTAPDCREAEDDPQGHWGTPWEGAQLSIRLQKEHFTNGEPIVACVTLRNISDRVLYFDVGPYPEEKDTKIVLTRGQERLLGVDDPKPGETFQERFRYVRAGSSPGFVPISPGTQRQFFRDLSKMFDLSVVGSYSAYAQRGVIPFERGRWTNLLSGTVTFRILGPQARN
jgi:hypothetical protein